MSGVRTRVGDLGDIPWWANAPAGITALLSTLCAASVQHLDTKAAAWLCVVAIVSFAVSLSRRVTTDEHRPSVDRRSNPESKRGSGWWLLLHAVMVGAGVAPFLFWARGSGAGYGAMTLIATTAAAIGLLFGSRSGLTIAIACSAGVLALSLAASPGLGGWWTGSGVPFWLAGITVVGLLISCAFVARLGLAELATGPNVPTPFSAPPTDKRGVGLFQTPSFATVRTGVVATGACVVVALLLEPFISPFTQRLGESTADRLTGNNSKTNATKGSVFKGANGRDQSLSQVLGANDSFTIDNFGATSDAEVLRVTFNVGRDRFRKGGTIPRSALLKGQSFDQWDGKKWFNTAEVTKELAPMEPTFPPERDPSLAGDVFLSRITVIRGSTNLIFGPSRIVQVDLSDQQLLLRSDDSVVTNTPMGPGTEYNVVTARHSFRDNAPDVDRSLLQSSAQDLLANGVRPEHLDVSALSQRSLALGRSFGERETSIQGVARNIQSWLTANTTYDFSVRHASSDRADVVDQFLFKTKAGWCEQIATSTVMLLRSNGIPARLATGYLPSAIDEDGSFRILGRDAHAWVEYYLPGYGWAQLDPTQQVPVAKLPPEKNSASDRSIPGAGLLIIGVLALLASAGLLLSRRRRSTELTPVERRIATLQDFGAARQRPRRSSETLTEYGTSLDAAIGATHEPVGTVVALLERERFAELQDPNTLPEVDERIQRLESEFPAVKPKNNKRNNTQPQ